MAMGRPTGGPTAKLLRAALAAFPVLAGMALPAAALAADTYVTNAEWRSPNHLKVSVFQTKVNWTPPSGRYRTRLGWMLGAASKNIEFFISEGAYRLPRNLEMDVVEEATRLAALPGRPRADYLADLMMDLSTLEVEQRRTAQVVNATLATYYSAALGKFFDAILDAGLNALLASRGVPVPSTASITTEQKATVLGLERVPLLWGWGTGLPSEVIVNQSAPASAGMAASPDAYARLRAQLVAQFLIAHCGCDTSPKGPLPQRPLFGNWPTKNVYLTRLAKLLASHSSHPPSRLDIIGAALRRSDFQVELKRFAEQGSRDPGELAAFLFDLEALQEEILWANEQWGGLECGKFVFDVVTGPIIATGLFGAFAWGPGAAEALGAILLLYDAAGNAVDAVKAMNEEAKVVLGIAELRLKLLRRLRDTPCQCPTAPGGSAGGGPGPGEVFFVIRVEGSGFVRRAAEATAVVSGSHEERFALRRDQDLRAELDAYRKRLARGPCDAGGVLTEMRRPEIWNAGPRITVVEGPIADRRQLDGRQFADTWRRGDNGPDLEALQKAAGCGR
jgi:hypothetical protein